MNLTDTHCHLDLENFDLDRPDVMERATRAGLVHILIPGLNLPSSRSAVKLAESHSLLYAAIGVHPTEVSTWNETSIMELSALASGASIASGSPSAFNEAGFSKVVAIGEIGLDYYWNAATREFQIKVLSQQLDLAARLGLPVILHMREPGDAQNGQCARDLLQSLETWIARLVAAKNPLADRPGVLHSFSGSLDTAHLAMGLGFYIGVTGAVTYTKARERQEIVTAVPLDRILLETDAPFQTPHPNRGKRNEPSYVRLIADKIALLHSLAMEEVAAATSENARRLFNWKETY